MNSKQSKSAAQRVVASTDSYTLRHMRRTIEAELIAAMDAGVKGTEAHLGQIELMEAATAELITRGELLEPPPYVEVDREDGYRLPFSVRVF